MCNARPSETSLTTIFRLRSILVRFCCSATLSVVFAPPIRVCHREPTKRIVQSLFALRICVTRFPVQTHKMFTRRPITSRSLVAQLANDSYNFAMTQLNQVAMPAAVAHARRYNHGRCRSPGWRRILDCIIVCRNNQGGLTFTCGETMEAPCALPDHSAVEAFAHLRIVITWRVGACCHGDDESSGDEGADTKSAMHL